MTIPTSGTGLDRSQGSLMDKEFKNTASPAERARQFHEDQRRLRQPPQGTTYHQLQHVDIELEAQGRFAGTKPEMGPAYPRLPEESPYNMQNAVEPPLGIDVSYVEPCGEAHEVAASMTSFPTESTAPAEAHRSSDAVTPSTAEPNSVGKTTLTPDVRRALVAQLGE
jgi:hypothetical protein